MVGFISLSRSLHCCTVYKLSEIKKNFDIDKAYKLLYNECIKEGADMMAEHKALNKLYELKIFKFERVK